MKIRQLVLIIFFYSKSWALQYEQTTKYVCKTTNCYELVFSLKSLSYSIQKNHFISNIYTSSNLQFKCTLVNNFSYPKEVDIKLHEKKAYIELSVLTVLKTSFFDKSEQYLMNSFMIKNRNYPCIRT
jgi:hypothetical protein